MKFGGTSLGSIDLILHAAQRIAAARSQGHDVVAVVSAMGKQTDHLLELAQRVSAAPPPREIDAIAATGELVSSGLLAAALDSIGVKSLSQTGAQAGISTDGNHTAAMISATDPEPLRKLLEGGTVPVVAGFQGAAPDGSTATLGRGGSDTTAAAIGAALRADECLIYTDVPGIFTADPRICPKARLLERINYEEILELASLGARVLHPRAVQFAGRAKLVLRVLSATAEKPTGTRILYTPEPDMEHSAVTGIAYNLEEAKITVRKVPDRPGVAAELFGRIASLGIDVDIIVQNVGDNDTTDMSFTVHRTQTEKAAAAAQAVAAKHGAGSVETDAKVAKVSAVGIGMREHAGIAAKFFGTLAQSGINIQMISTSEIRISVIIDEVQATAAVQALHTAFGLDADTDAGPAAAAA